MYLSLVNCQVISIKYELLVIDWHRMVLPKQDVRQVDVNGEVETDIFLINARKAFAEKLMVGKSGVSSRHLIDRLAANSS